MECFIFKNGVEVKAGLEDILTLLGDNLLQNILRNAWKTIDLSDALAFMPQETKDKAYNNLPLRIRCKIKEAVERMESAKETTEDTETVYARADSYFEEARTKLISLIGEYSKEYIEGSDCFILRILIKTCP